jgi:hypothetical protein
MENEDGTLTEEKSEKRKGKRRKLKKKKEA